MEKKFVRADDTSLGSFFWLIFKSEVTEDSFCLSFYCGRNIHVVSRQITSTMREMRGPCRVSVGKLEEMRQLERPRLRCKIKIGPLEIGWSVDWIHVAQYRVAGASEYSSESLGSIKCAEFVGWLRNLTFWRKTLPGWINYLTYLTNTTEQSLFKW